MTSTIDPHSFFELARCYSEQHGLNDQVTWQRGVNVHRFTEQELLREMAWVILCSGFREKIVRKLFDHVSLCFCDWESATAIQERCSTCVRGALRSINNEKKLRAIATCASMIASSGFEQVKQAIINDPLRELQRFPFIGPVTAWHVAKNLGLNVSKPDRHLMRLAEACGYRTALSLCADLANDYGEQINVIDLILWRYLADHPGLLRPFANTSKRRRP